MDSFFRVIPSTPRVKEGELVLNVSPTSDAGKSVALLLYAIMLCSWISKTD